MKRLEQVLARSEWQGGEFAEGLMRDQSGRVIEGVFSNLFIVQGDLRDPAHRRATVNVEQAINTPVEQSDQKLLAANQTIDKQLVQARQQQLTPALDTPTQKGPMLA